MQRILDRQLHVRRAELGDHRAVDEFHQRMDDRLRVHDHVDLLGREIEQPAGFDDLERLVHHRGRIDRDLRAHAPIRMAQGLFDRDAGQLLGRVAEKGSAAGGQHDPPHLLAAARLQRLKDGAVLAIDRKDRCPGLGRQAHDQRPGHDERFFVRQRDRLAGLDGRPGAAQAGAADDRRKNRYRRSRRPRCGRAPPARSATRTPRGKPLQSCRAAALGSVATTHRGRNCRACSTSAAVFPWPTGRSPAAPPRKRRSRPARCVRCCRSSRAQRRGRRICVAQRVNSVTVRPRHRVIL